MSSVWSWPFAGSQLMLTRDGGEKNGTSLDRLKEAPIALVRC